MLTYDLIINVYPAAFAASRATVCRHHDDSSPHNIHRPRLNSIKKQSSANINRNHHLRNSQRQKVYNYTADTCDNPELQDIPLQDLSISNEDYQCNNNYEDTYNINNLKVITREGVSLPVHVFPQSFIQWPIEGSTKSRRIAEIKKQVKLLGKIIKMTVSPVHQNGAEGAYGGSPSNPPPFSQLVEMSHIPAAGLTAAVDDSTQVAKWEDISGHLQAARLKEAKTVIRDAEWSMSSIQRESLWRNLCIYQSTDKDFSDFYYWDTVKQIYGTTELSDCHIQLPAFIDAKHCEKRSLSQCGAIACERIISVITYSNPTITYAPSVYTITSMLLHYMEEHDAYNCMNALVSGAQNKFVTQTKLCNEATWRATMMLAKKHIRGSFSTLGKFGVTTVQLEEAFQKWSYWILEYLPLPHLVRILDCFLLEGSKVLMRVSLAIFQMFVKAVTRDSSMAASLPSRGVSEAINRFCQGLQMSPNKLLKTAFGIRGFSKTEINKVTVQMEMMLKSQRNALGDVGTEGMSPSMGRSSSLEGLPTSESQANIQMMSHTLTIKELLTVWSWLPVRMTMTQPELVYTTEEHGCSLTTFFLRCQKFAPTLLLVRTTKDYVFGAYLSSPWATRNKQDEFGNRQTYFGTGESFLFSLRPQSARYEWVGINQQKSGGPTLEHSAELFMHADNTMLSIGGGGGQGIQLDEELRFGKTEWCQTFNNPPLCPESDFEVKVIEVYSLSNES
ncbi:unnamed protein product [Meganyctiphanes norvegica]|uniref:TBC1 domain family member 24 n=1 Tax=Meganyctiphanes norvegica TaxID=48144 RepID=A0AAV2RGF5_MEGNR